MSEKASEMSSPTSEPTRNDAFADSVVTIVIASMFENETVCDAFAPIAPSVTVSVWVNVPLTFVRDSAPPVASPSVYVAPPLALPTSIEATLTVAPFATEVACPPCSRPRPRSPQANR